MLLIEIITFVFLIVMIIVSVELHHELSEEKKAFYNEWKNDLQDIENKDNTG